MPAAQSFIQLLETFLAILISLLAANFSYTKKQLLIYKTAKKLGNTGFRREKTNFIYPKKKYPKGIKLKIRKIYYILLIFRYISFSSHEIAKFVF